MPTNRSRAPRKRRHSEVSELAWRYLNDLSTPADRLTWEYSNLKYNRGFVTSILWDRYGAEITAAWIKDKPGTRPSCWWRFAAPRLPEQPAHTRFPKVEARRVLFGLVDNQPAWEFGLPYFRDPNTHFESEAEYLARHNLLADNEK
jgi:hypothetical protein